MLMAPYGSSYFFRISLALDCRRASKVTGTSCSASPVSATTVPRRILNLLGEIVIDEVSR